MSDYNTFTDYIRTCRREYGQQPTSFLLAEGEPAECIRGALAALESAAQHNGHPDGWAHKEAAYRALCRAIAALDFQGVRPHKSVGPERAKAREARVAKIERAKAAAGPKVRKPKRKLIELGRYVPEARR